MLSVEDLVLRLTSGLSADATAWKPESHPSDHNGEFKPKTSGVFNPLSDARSGKLNSAGVFNGEAGHGFGLNPDVAEVLPGEKIGGVEIHAPAEHGYSPSVHTVDWKLQGGDKVYRVTGGPKVVDGLNGTSAKGQNGVIVHHGDGGATALMPTPEGEMPKVGLTDTHFSAMLEALQGMGYEIDVENPLDLNDKEEADELAKQTEETQETPEEEAKESTEKPIGETGPGGNTVVQNLFDEKSGEHIGHIEKTPEGKYTSHDASGKKVGNISKHVHTAVEKVKSGKLTTPATYQHKKAPKEKVALSADEPAHLEGREVLHHIHDDDNHHIGHIELSAEGELLTFGSTGETIDGASGRSLLTAIADIQSADKK